MPIFGRDPDFSGQESSMADINEEFLTQKGMTSARRALISKFPWLLHVKPVSQFQEIKENGLKPRAQGCPTNQLVKAALMMQNVDKMTFFRPMGTFDSTPTRDGRKFMLAMKSSMLPKIITLDWTYTGNFELASILKVDCQEATSDDIFCEVVRRRGAFAVYELIPATLLQVWTKGRAEDDPSTWSQLIDTEISDLAEFG
jgi:hypothetical protein